MSVVPASECQSQAELKLAHRAGAGDPAERRRSQCGVGSVQVYQVEEVGELGAKLQGHALGPLVSGAGRDIGQAVAIELARCGADVAFTYHCASGEPTAAAVQAFSRQVDAVDSAAVREFVEWAAAQAGRPADILVNVVGGLVARKTIEQMDEAFWDGVLALNLKSVFLLTKAALPYLSDGGAIVNIASQAGRDGGGPGGTAYGAAKGALMAFTRGLAKELGPRRIRVNGVCPGMIDTTFHDTFTKPEVRQRVASMTPLGREGRSEEVASLVAYLASSAASFVNGANIDINGGILFS